MTFWGVILILIVTMNKADFTRKIKNAAADLGFDRCGAAPADFLDKEAQALERWLTRHMHGQMDYMAKRVALRLDPRRLMPGAKSVLSLLYNYCTPKTQAASQYKISTYAYGRDYHHVIRQKLRRLTAMIREMVGDIQIRGCVDSAPIMEKAWATRCGLGWVGKNGNLVTADAGSYFFLAELILDVELEYDRPAFDHCGRCRRCLDACPTGAIIEPYVIDARQCISYLTIELKGTIPPEMKHRYRDWIFGCDVCQQVCPFNRFSSPHTEKDFEPAPEFLAMSDGQWRRLTPAKYESLFRGSAVKRAGYEGLMRNIRFLEK